MKMRIDTRNQWFVIVKTVVGDMGIPVAYKVDTGCNGLILSHATLKQFGMSTTAKSLSKLKSANASGIAEDIKLGEVGMATLYYDKLLIGTFRAYCHPTRETHDLLGSPVLQAFEKVDIDLKTEPKSITLQNPSRT
jgi:hypothetical protein